MIEMIIVRKRHVRDHETSTVRIRMAFGRLWEETRGLMELENHGITASSRITKLCNIFDFYTYFLRDNDLIMNEKIRLSVILG